MHDTAAFASITDKQFLKLLQQYRACMPRGWIPRQGKTVRLEVEMYLLGSRTPAKKHLATWLNVSSQEPCPSPQERPRRSLLSLSAPQVFKMSTLSVLPEALLCIALLLRGSTGCGALGSWPGQWPKLPSQGPPRQPLHRRRRCRSGCLRRLLCHGVR